MNSRGTGALWFGIGLGVTLLIWATLSVYVLDGYDPYLGKGISMNFSLWMIAIVWVVAVFVFAAGAHWLKASATRTRSFVAGFLVALVFFPLFEVGVERFPVLEAIPGWLLMSAFLAVCFGAAKLCTMALRRQSAVG